MDFFKKNIRGSLIIYLSHMLFHVRSNAVELILLFRSIGPARLRDTTLLEETSMTWLTISFRTWVAVPVAHFSLLLISFRFHINHFYLFLEYGSALEAHRVLQTVIDNSPGLSARLTYFSNKKKL